MSSLLERFLAKVSRPSGTDCWIWTGSKNARGRYGAISVDGKQNRAHRIAYELYRGPIPAGLTIDHLCGNTLCVNPEHLETVTLRENIIRSNSPSALNARLTHCPKCGGDYRVNGEGKRFCPPCRAALYRVHERKRPKRVRRKAGLAAVDYRRQA